MFERYTEKARRVIFYGRYEASQFGSRLIETEHILLGILREEKVLVLQLLKLPEAFEILRKEIENNTVVGEKVATSVDLPLSNESKRALVTLLKKPKKWPTRVSLVAIFCWGYCVKRNVLPLPC